MQESEEYKFKGIPITALIAENIILRLFEGKIVERKTIVENVLDFHLSNGGLKPNGVNYIGPIKKALRKLQKVLQQILQQDIGKSEQVKNLLLTQRKRMITC
ncbi:hypothetical protein [Solitalea koreensis]|uniref:Uncharacterized protein n=1 Tax=Solitalea koreensis TaxID=543615 RepID=A0A521D0S9_9SPHI|nr:hypothetical protein [Solitalea koreensis]SMO64500.1 hypothetical protein SAMN06265350_10552 [Solitalea koreensis]